jgi:soluble lytic murein transglycosylase-like protein
MATDYTSLITLTANQYGVDPALALAVAQKESSMNPAAVSSAGAIGLFQLEPATAASLGVDPYDPAQNIQGGIRYLSQLLNQYNGDTSLALAAYNAGPGNVAKYGGVPPFAETQNYVSSILSTLGLSPPAFPSPAPEPRTDPESSQQTLEGEEAD